MSKISVVVHGALGKVGREVVSAVEKNPDMALAGGVDIKAKTDFLVLDNQRQVPLSNNMETLLNLCKPDVMVDFSIAEASMAAARTAASKGISLVIGTTGFSQQNIKELETLAKKHSVGMVVASNFALGVVIMIHLARMASKYFDTAEIIELHHDQKIDAPSGTAISTARAMSTARGKPFVHGSTEKEIVKGTRGGALDGIAIHSVRLPGFVASQEIIFGLQGQTLSLRHNALNRECYMPGVMLAINETLKIKGSVRSLEDLLNLGGT
jgi:4-hydroxy-tetrahydrodipicolinate reductase